MTAATASDYKSAVGAALASGDNKDAEAWLRYGLDAYPKDAQMLTLGARFEQARGNNGRAADYFRASLAALPPGDPGSELATELSQPDTRRPAPLRDPVPGPRLASFERRRDRRQTPQFRTPKPPAPTCPASATSAARLPSSFPEPPARRPTTDRPVSFRPTWQTPPTA